MQVRLARPQESALANCRWCGSIVGCDRIGVMTARLRKTWAVRFSRTSMLNRSLLAGGLSLFLATPAAADAVKVGLLPIGVQGELADHVREELEDRLAGGLARGGFEVLGSEQVLEADGQAESCSEAACFVRVAQASSSSRLIKTSITVEGRDYEVALSLIDGSTGQVIATVRDTCDICGVEELGQVIEDVGAALRRKLDAQTTLPPTLVIETEPSGAIVLVDGEPVGTTPLDVVVDPGEASLQIKMEGFLTERQRLTFVDGVRERISLSLEAAPSDIGGEEQAKARTLGGVGWAAVALGLAAAGTGGALVAIDERPHSSRCGPENLDPQGDCKWRYNSLGAGIGMLVGGGALLAAGITLVVIAAKRKRGSGAKKRASALPGGLAVHF